MSQPQYVPQEYVISSPRQWEGTYERLLEVDNELDIHDPAILVLEPGRTQAPRSLPRFGITAILPLGASYLRRSLMSLPTIHAQRPIAFEYRVLGNEPCVDGSFAVGLTYDTRLVGLASGGLSTIGPIVTQVQDVSLRDRAADVRSREYYRNGLHDGIAWKQTLLNAWCAMMHRTLPGIVGDMEGLPIFLQSAVNNRWLDRKIIINAYPGTISEEEIAKRQAARARTLPLVYDALAESVGAELDPETHNYVLPQAYNVPMSAPA